METFEPAINPAQVFGSVINDKLNQWTTSYIQERILDCSDITDGRVLHKKLKIPYLQVQLPEWEPEQMIAEARASRHLFVPHRASDSMGWMSLCLHGIDSEKTRAFESYGYANEAEVPYAWTDASAACPQTTAWLKSLVAKGFFTKLFRVRYMWLEPGGFISFHQDRPDGMTSLGPLNIALNMPKDCHWLFENYGHVPFSGGTAFCVDISNKHGVWNNSIEDRIHIIVHGTYGPAYYDALARGKAHLLEQAQARPSSQLVAKKPKAQNPRVAYAIWDYFESSPSSEYSRKLKAVTTHFLRLRSNHVVKFHDDHSLQRILTECAEAGYDWCAISTPGNIAGEKFFQSIEAACKNAKPEVALMGHLLDRKERGFGLHHQFFAVRISAWIESGRPRFAFKSLETQNIIAAKRSAENIHDDYTPLWIRPSEGEVRLKPGVFGWNALDKFMRRGFEVANLPDAVRKEKKYLYPEQNPQSVERLLDNITTFEQNLDDLELSPHQKSIAHDLCMEGGDFGRKVFLFNTEGLGDVVRRKNRVCMDAVLSVSAGFKDLHILDFNGFHEATELHYFDISAQALFLKKYIFENWDGRDFPSFLRRLRQNIPPELAQAQFTVNESDFEYRWMTELTTWESEEAFFTTYSKARQLKKNFHQIDILANPTFAATIIAASGGRNFAIWYSNCFNFTPALAKMNWDLSLIERAGQSFMASLHRTALSQSKEILLYGEDTRFGARCEYLGHSAREVFS